MKKYPLGAKKHSREAVPIG